ncbi:hypothetical protein PtrV1_02245 [Pyrenophora tritici-repentis]|uniref:Uncharacterized protein n=1 Tax=Pyrenophora tritici-repentis TaxID=45151 RepID=A0A5M9LRL0_9PLEO|nr:hypothetical protein PtrV1_02245 [Pyrenophora tritici-repentis]KAF7578147.1 hypothetical protein PtrM4_023870 [Pyrenophora tritici-repentis]KAI0578206.1 hypothetical protein Alg215_06473 [Pyrenophora tritici-repentis]
MEEEGCAETVGGGGIGEDGATCMELSGVGVVVASAVDEGATGGVDVGSRVADAEDGAAGGVGSEALRDGLVYADDGAAELGTTGAGAADAAGTSGVGDGITVVNDVTIITGGICSDADGDISDELDEADTLAMSKVDEAREGDS